MVPSGWKLSTIEDISTVSSGGTPSRKEPSYWDGDIPWVTTAEVKFGTISDSSEKITTRGLNNSSAKLFPKDTILMAMYGQGKTRGQVAKLGIKASTNQACAAIQLDSKSDVEYYFQFLQSRYQHIRDMANSGGQKNLSSGIVKSIQVPIPPLPEQKRIAEILSTWDKAITTTEQLLANSQQQKKALMQQLLTGKKRLFDDNGQVFSSEWSSKRLKSLGETLSGGTPSTTEAGFWDGNIVWVTPTDITKLNKKVITSSARNISQAGLKGSSAKLIPKGSLIVCTRATIGFMAIAGTELTTNQGFKNLVPNDECNIEFLYYALTQERHQMLAKSSGSTFLELSKKDFDNLKIKIPFIEEQQKIAAVLSTADTEIDTLKQKLDHLKQEKKALMQQLLTGKRRVKA